MITRPPLDRLSKSLVLGFLFCAVLLLGPACNSAVIPGSSDPTNGSDNSQQDDSGLNDNVAGQPIAPGGNDPATDPDGDTGSGETDPAPGNPVDDSPGDPIVEPGNGGGNNPPPPAACPSQAFFPLTDGCTLTLRTPADCATVSFGAEFAWEGDACHTPYYLQIAGNSSSETYNEIYINSYVNAPSWAEPLNESDLEGLDTDDGWYHWRVCNAYESGCSGSRAFRLE